MNGEVSMSQLNITGISNQLNRFKTQIQSESIKTKEGYTGLLNDALKQSYWDLMVAKLDVFLNQITNGSWSLSEKTVLIQKVDSFKESFSCRLNELSDKVLANSEHMSSWIDKEIFCFVLREMSTAQLPFNINFSLKSEKEAQSVIQLNNAGELLAEYPFKFNKGTVLPKYGPEMEKHIPPELSQRLYTLMSSYEQYCSWRKSHDDLMLDIMNTTPDELPFDSLQFSLDKHISLKFYDTLFELRSYLNSSGYNTFSPVNLTLTNDVPSESWFPVRDWLIAANTNVGTASDMPDEIQGHIYALLNIKQQA